jgi:hypothetical protein
MRPTVGRTFCFVAPISSEYILCTFNAPFHDERFRRDHIAFLCAPGYNSHTSLPCITWTKTAMQYIIRILNMHVDPTVEPWPIAHSVSTMLPMRSSWVELVVCVPCCLSSPGVVQPPPRNASAIDPIQVRIDVLGLETSRRERFIGCQHAVRKKKEQELRDFIVQRLPECLLPWVDSPRTRRARKFHPCRRASHVSDAPPRARTDAVWSSHPEWESRMSQRRRYF